MERGTGRTKQQMLAAPHGALFVWVNQHIDYPRALAYHIGRGDLQIVSPGWLERNTQGREFSGIVVDHAADLSEEQVYALHCARIKVPNAKVSGGGAFPPSA